MPNPSEEEVKLLLGQCFTQATSLVHSKRDRTRMDYKLHLSAVVILLQVDCIG